MFHHIYLARFGVCVRASKIFQLHYCVYFYRGFSCPSPVSKFVRQRAIKWMTTARDSAAEGLEEESTMKINCEKTSGRTSNNKSTINKVVNKRNLQVTVAGRDKVVIKP